MSSVRRELSSINNQLSRIELKLDTLLRKEKHMAGEIEALTDKVTKISGAADSAVELITNLSAYIRANSADPAAIAALADSLDAKANELGEAVAANPTP